MTGAAEIDGVRRVERRRVHDRRPPFAHSIFLNEIGMRFPGTMAGFTRHTRHDVADQAVAKVRAVL